MQNRPTRIRVGYKTHYLIISKTRCIGESEREGQRENFQNCYIFFACRADFRVTTTIWPCNRGKRLTFRVVFRVNWFVESRVITASLDASLVACIFALALALMCCALHTNLRVAAIDKLFQGEHFKCCMFIVCRSIPWHGFHKKYYAKTV